MFVGQHNWAVFQVPYQSLIVVRFIVNKRDIKIWNGFFIRTEVLHRCRHLDESVYNGY